MNNYFLITGASGYIGSALTFALLDAGFNVMGIDKEPFPFRILDDFQRSHFEFIHQDLTENDYEEFVDYCNCAVAVIHLAAIVGPYNYRAFYYSLKNFNINNEINKNLEFVPENVPIFFASTSELYGDKMYADENSELKFNVDPDGRYLYSLNKFNTETFLKTLEKNDTCTFRLFNIVGSIANNQGRRIIVQDKHKSFFANIAQTKNAVKIYSNGARSYCHIFDAVKMILNRVLWQVEGNKFPKHDVMNVGNPDNFIKNIDLEPIIRKLYPDRDVSVIEKQDYSGYRLPMIKRYNEYRAKYEEIFRIDKMLSIEDCLI